LARKACTPSILAISPVFAIRRILTRFVVVPPPSEKPITTPQRASAARGIRNTLGRMAITRTKPIAKPQSGSCEAKS
jgi:hypothetical protein